MRRATLGAFRSTPLGVVSEESKPTPREFSWTTVKDARRTDRTRRTEGRSGGSAVRRGHYTSTPDRVWRASTFHPALKPAGWSGRRSHLGDNKEVFGEESYALCQALKTFEMRGEEMLFFRI